MKYKIKTKKIPILITYLLLLASVVLLATELQVIISFSLLISFLFGIINKMNIIHLTNYGIRIYLIHSYKWENIEYVVFKNQQKVQVLIKLKHSIVKRGIPLNIEKKEIFMKEFKQFLNQHSVNIKIEK